MVDRQVIIPKEMELIHQKFRYAPAVRVGDTLYISGQVGRDENLRVIEGGEAQITRAFENLGAVLAAANAGFEDVVDLITYHTDMRDLPIFMEIKDRYFKQDYPTWTAIGTPALAMVGLIVEIKATAIVRHSG